MGSLTLKISRLVNLLRKCLCCFILTTALLQGAKCFPMGPRVGRSFGESVRNTAADDSAQYETIIRTPDMNDSYAALAKEIIITPSATLLKMSVDLLPTEYMVPKRNTLKYWPNKTIAVDISSRFAPEERITIWNALQALSESVDSCITFINKTFHESDFLFFQKGKLCDARIGYNGGRHVVKLSVECLDPGELGFVQHEVLHALGFFHEHSRSDRDNWVDINYENVKPIKKKEFSKLKFRTWDLPYDYLSVLHYSSDACAVNDTIPTVKPTSLAVSLTTIGQRKGLSPTDIQRVKIPYMCGENLAIGDTRWADMNQRRQSRKQDAVDDPYASPVQQEQQNDE
ncbi:hatching enzyme 1.2-like [Paramacrobiotus metropolitanus]|uniref:hatching enzyme 1.2-like n=1 Tax=Paramacrobiotus metropolitanus TaxID=2943436 RepID=UPI002445C8A9|nr:hatching enzyme 1.2-like [Paramacrobiotus metropolitanus]